MGGGSGGMDGSEPRAAFAVGNRFRREAGSGGGPGYIEALTYRIGAHTTSDDPTRYRDDAELEAWQKRDPIHRFENYLRALGVEEEFFERVRAESDVEAKRVRDEILHLPAPEPDTMFAHVYSEPHPRIDEQRAWLEQYEASFTEDTK